MCEDLDLVPLIIIRLVITAREFHKVWRSTIDKEACPVQAVRAEPHSDPIDGISLHLNRLGDSRGSAHPCDLQAVIAVVRMLGVDGHFSTTARDLIVKVCQSWSFE